jgi:glycosyltransferase involved in cell wall biosynthesis
MKIIILGTAHPYRGGLAAFNERLAKEYVSQGHDVEVYTFTMQYPSFLFPGKTQYTDEPAPENINIKRIVNSVNPFSWIKTGREIKKKKADLVVVGYWLPFMAPCLGTISRIIRKNKTTKVISIVHNMIPHESHFTDKMLSSYFVGSVDGFVTLSKSVLDDIATFNKQKPKTYCPHPLYDHFGKKLLKEIAIKKLELDPDFRYMLFFGFIRDYKGLDLLMKAYADERFRNKNIKLIVAGEFYSNDKLYFDLEKELDLMGNIIWANEFIPDNQVGAYFCAADIIVQPYKTATESGVTQIAYHFEKPMLVTNVGGLSEIVPHGKVGYITETNEKDIANALLDYFDNNRELSFVENVKIEKEKYSWKRMTESINELRVES